ncbi:hypothetical protein Cob_v011977 [Colletotrichum orbiculare MAFF 240422]|uniref:Uncharacterized protein n=1 Tax=Colletotrichum orbiculare (strain 104-T / ATCC 96160 / CBS 514.97 / LARS 414 / MAFF 240422) TaxID=1213857 RepID=A0A484FC71_COLOR|nr:hypothetical protein Cob_v011977 [Colletotrichum orbiculare MAFF 240422]
MDVAPPTFKRVSSSILIYKHYDTPSAKYLIPKECRAAGVAVPVDALASVPVLLSCSARAWKRSACSLTPQSIDRYISAPSQYEIVAPRLPKASHITRHGPSEEAQLHTVSYSDHASPIRQLFSVPS